MNWLVSAGIDRAQRGLEDDVAEDLVRPEVEREAGFDLALRDRLDAGADDLGRVGAEVHDHRRQRRGVRATSAGRCAGSAKKKKNSCTRNGVLRMSSM